MKKKLTELLKKFSKSQTQEKVDIQRSNKNRTAGYPQYRSPTSMSIRTAKY